MQGIDLKLFRVARGLSQAALGQRTRLSQARISELERGLPARPDELKRIMRVLSSVKK